MEEQILERCDKVYMRKVSGVIWISAIGLLITLFSILYGASYSAVQSLQSKYTENEQQESYQRGVRDGRILSLETRTANLEQSLNRIEGKLDALIAAEGK